MQAIGENILVLRPREVERKQGSLIIPNNRERDDYFMAQLLSVGSDIEDLKLVVGADVFVANCPNKLKLGDKTDGEVLLVHYDDILAVVEDGEV
jgi:co-chaperonin GroES (HSP10)